MKTAIKRVLPDGVQPRTLPVGIGRGIRMDLDFAHETRLFLGLYEIELNRYLRRYCSPGTKAFDVGGQHGYDALVMAKLTRSDVISFEADREACERMARTFGLNPELSNRVSAVPAFVGTGLDGTVSLDDHARRSFWPGLVKIDVEGAELDVLRGASDVLSRRPAIILEVHSQELERACGELLAEHGYRPTIVNQRKVAPDYRPTDARNRWLVAAH